MKRIFVLLVILLAALNLNLNAQVKSIAEVQGGGDVTPFLGQAVTIKGAVTGVYSTGYFMRDSEEPRSGMYVYEQTHKPQLGDTIQVRGTVTEYSNCTEMQTITSYTVISTGNPTPLPVLLTTADLDESWEDCFVMVKNAKCTQETLGYGEWQVNDGSGPAVVNDLGYAYSPKLNESYDITGNLSFSFGFYKIEPRFAADVVVAAVIFINSAVYPDIIEKNAISLSWSTNAAGSTEVQWGLTPELEGGSLKDETNSLSHSMKIDGLSPATFYYIKPFSVTGPDTTFSKALLYSTSSESSGKINVCFTRGVIPARSTDQPGVYTYAMIDTMVAYVNKAESTLDLAIYDFSNFAASSDDRNKALVDAVNTAFQRGVVVRFITDANLANPVLLNNLDPAIPLLRAKTAAIMHDKFMVVDRESVMNSWLVSGSTNPTFNNLVLDLNNLVAIQDQSVAKAYTLEFNEMYGSDGASPDTLKSLIGSNKKDNTPHFFMVGGKRMEVYFSPSDFTTSHIVAALNTAESSIDFSMMAFTEDALGNALVNAKTRGVKVKGEIDYIEYSGSEYPKLITAGIKVLDFKNPDGSAWPDGPTLHDKFAVVDAGTENAAVITGSHNWTAAADSKNDENTLIIHDSGISKLYKAESDRIYSWLKPMICSNDTVKTLDLSYVIIDVTANDTLPKNFTMSIVREPVFGQATINPDLTITYSSLLDCICDIKDTIVYQVCSGDDPDYCTQASVYISMNLTKIYSCTNDYFTGSHSSRYNIKVIENDVLPSDFTFTITREPVYGTTMLVSDYSIRYELNALATGKQAIYDTLIYQVCDNTNPDLCLLDTVFIFVDISLSIDNKLPGSINLWPNPVIDELHVSSGKTVSGLEVFDITGKVIYRENPLKSDFSILMTEKKGLYFVRLTLDSGEVIMRKVLVD